jgi:hypothetical protein
LLTIVGQKSENRFDYLGDASNQVIDLILRRVRPFIVIAQIAQIAEVLDKSPGCDVDDVVVLQNLVEIIYCRGALP